MSRGKLGVATFNLAVVLGVLLLTGAPAISQSTVSSPAAGTDELAPAPVGLVAAEVDLAGPSVVVTWEPSADDFVRQTSGGNDFTSAGVFVNVNDVAAYNVYRNGELIASLAWVDDVSAGSGEGTFTDTDVTNGMVYVYEVTAVDASDNESSAVGAPEALVGSIPEQEQEIPESVEIEVVEIVEVSMSLAMPEEEATAIIEDPVATESFIEDFVAAIAALLGIDPSRINVFGLDLGSLVVSFEILDDPEAPEEASALEVIAELEEIVAEEPGNITAALADEGIEAPVEAEKFIAATSVVTTGLLTFDDVDVDATVSEEFEYTNNATEEDALLSIRAEIEGDGYSVEPASLLLGPGESDAFTLTFDAAEVSSLTGIYDGVLTLTSNDPSSPETVIAVEANIEDGLVVQDIDLIGTFVFGNVATATTQSKKLTVRNLGDLDLTGSLVLVGDSAFSVSATEFVLAGSETVDITVKFTPTEEASYSSTITVTSNDAHDAEIKLDVTGAGASGEEKLVQVDAAGTQLKDDLGNPIILKGDLDNSGDIGFQDFFIFAAVFGKKTSDADFNAAADFDASGDIGFQDFFIFAADFGKKGLYVTIGGA